MNQRNDSTPAPALGRRGLLGLLAALFSAPVGAGVGRRRRSAGSAGAMGSGLKRRAAWWLDASDR